MDPTEALCLFASVPFSLMYPILTTSGKHAVIEKNTGTPVSLHLTLQLVTPPHLSLLYYHVNMLFFTLVLLVSNQLPLSCMSMCTLTTTFSPTTTTVFHPASWLMTGHLKHFMLTFGTYVEVAPAYISTFILCAHALHSDCYHLSVTSIIFCLFLPQMSHTLDDLLK